MYMKQISCACNCGNLIEEFDNYGRKRKFISGHNNKKYTDPKQYKREWNNRNRIRIQEKEKTRRADLKAHCLQRYGNVCNCCQESEPEFLTMDHINGNGSKHRRETKGNHIYSILKKENYPETYRILCFNCNWSSYIGNGICKHKR